MSQGTSSFICVGCITAAHGLKGNVTIRSFTENPIDILSYGPLLTETGEEAPKITLLHPTKESLFVAQLDGVACREVAETYKGLSLYVKRDALPNTDSNTYYQNDLIGLIAQDETGHILGTIKGIHDFGAGTLLEIGEKDPLKTWMLPFQKETVPVVNIKEGYVVLSKGAINDWKDT